MIDVYSRLQLFANGWWRLFAGIIRNKMEDLFKEFNLTSLDRLLLIDSPICSIIGI